MSASKYTIGLDYGTNSVRTLTLAACGVPLTRAATLEQAVREARALAQPGDAVLLSPACASFDMFRNYAHRAEVFVAAVRGLQEGRA